MHGKPFLLIGALALVPAAMPAEGTLRPLGGRIRVDQSPGCGAFAPDLAPLPAGWVAVWSEYRRVLARFFDLAGAPRSPVLEVATVATLQPGDVHQPEVVTDAQGRSFVAWWDGAAGRFLARRFGPHGEALGATFAIATAQAFGGFDLGVGADGEVTAVWGAAGSLVVRQFDAAGQPLGPPTPVFTSFSHLPGAGKTILSPRLALHGPERFTALWIDPAVPQGTGPLVALEVRREGGTFAADAEAQEIGNGEVLAAAAVAMPDGGYAAAWTLPWPAAQGIGVYLRRFDAAGRPRGDAVPIDAEAWSNLGRVQLALGTAGDLLVVWEGWPLYSEAAGSALFARGVDRHGAPLGSRRIVPPVVDLDDRLGPAVATLDDGSWVVAWYATAGPLADPPICVDPGVFAQRFVAATDPAPGTLALGDDRFELAITFEDPRRGLAGTGQGVQLTRDTGYFWFFAAENAEVVVKVLDGRAVNGHFWVFYGSLTDVGFRLTVTDVATGATKEYVNPPGTMASRGDTAAFRAGSPSPGAPIHRPSSRAAPAARPF